MFYLRSFGLTMLAVAEGKFPFANNIGPSAANGGFWEMVKAICDDDAP